jgi:hypothetical protein
MTRRARQQTAPGTGSNITRTEKGFTPTGIASIMPELINSGLPLAVIASFEFAAQKYAHYARRLSVFEFSDDFYACRSALRHLRHKKCRCVAYISLYHHETWSRDRLQRILQEAESGSDSLTIQPLTQQQPDWNAKAEMYTHPLWHTLRQLYRAIVSFDDTTTAERLGITSFHFNSSALTRKIVMSLLRPPPQLYIPSSEGYLVERD